MYAEIAVSIILGLIGLIILKHFLPYVLCFFYCYTQRKKARRNELRKSAVSTNSTSVTAYKNEVKQKSKLKCMASAYRRKKDAYLYGLTRYMSIKVGRIPSHRLRKWILRNIFCMRIAKKAVIYGGFEIRSPWKITVGNSVVGVGALLDGRNGIIIEDDVCLAQNVYIYTEQHDVNDPDFKCNNKGGRVIIEHHAWVSSRTTILPRCVVKEGCVIASGATITRSTESPYGIYAGLPAKRIAERKSPMEYTLCKASYWHFY